MREWDGPELPENLPDMLFLLVGHQEDDPEGAEGRGEKVQSQNNK